jgi:hypothetical protein
MWQWLTEQVCRVIVLRFLFGFLVLALDVLTHGVFAAAEGYGVLPTVVPGPAVAGIGRRRLFGLPAVATGDAIGRNVASALKRWDFRSLTRDGLSCILCIVLQDEQELEGFRRVFLGLMQITGLDDELA